MTKEQLQTTHKNTTSVIERTLWHGTTGGTENSITLNGFNRSYSGKTHSKLLWCSVLRGDNPIVKIIGTRFP